MRLSLWNKYHLLKIIGPLVTVFISSILLISKLKLFAIFIWFLGLLFTAIILHSIKCPKCGKSIDNYETLLSGPEGGWFSPMSKICKNCGFDFSSCKNSDSKNI